jgi:hypothetical protein
MPKQSALLLVARVRVVAPLLLFLSVVGTSHASSHQELRALRLLLTPQQLATAIPARMVGGSRWLLRWHGVVKRDFSERAARIVVGATFVPKAPIVRAYIVQSVGWFERPSAAMQNYRVWRETSLSALTRPHSAAFSIKHLGNAAGGYQITGRYYDVRFVDGPIVEKLLFTSNGPSLPRKAIINLAWQAYHIERYHR